MWTLYSIGIPLSASFQLCGAGSQEDAALLTIILTSTSQGSGVIYATYSYNVVHLFPPLMPINFNQLCFECLLGFVFDEFLE